MPKNPVLVGAKSSSLGSGDYVTFRNHTRNGVRRVKCTTDGEAILEDVPNDWVNGDSISIETYGRYKYGATVAISKGGINSSLGTLTADTSSSAVSL